MTDDNTICVGDICTYSYDNDNKSLSIVEVVEEFSDEVLVVKFLQVIVDDSGNGLFTYLHKTARTMNVSKKYLHKILLINRQKAEIEKLKEASEEAVSCFHRMESLYNIKCMELKVAKAEAIKEFAEKYKERLRDVSRYDFGQHAYYMVGEQFIDNLVKEMVGDAE